LKTIHNYIATFKNKALPRNQNNSQKKIWRKESTLIHKSNGMKKAQSFTKHIYNKEKQLFRKA
jgi:hypothetical protein